MAYTYDTTSYTKGFMMLGSSKIRTLESLTDNVKKLTCSEISSHYYDTDRYPISGIPMLAYRMVNGKSALRVVDVQAITGLQGSFGTLTDKTVLNGCSVQVATNGLNDYILHLQKLTDLDYVPMNKSTDYSGMQWLLDEDHSLAIVTTEQQPRAFKKFMFGHKLILCGEYSDGFSPVALIDIESASSSYSPAVTSGLILHLDASNSASYPGSGTTWTDIVGGYNGTLTNGPTFVNEDGGVISFDGNNDYVNIADNAALRGSTTGELTIQIWAKISSFTAGDGLFGKQYGVTKDYDGYSLAIQTNNVLRLQMNGLTVNGGYNSANNVWSLNTWHLFTAVIDFGGSPKAYVDTTNVVSVNNAENSIPNNDASLRIGQSIQEGTPYPVMKVGAFYVYNRALSAAEITSNYNATKARFGL